MKSVRNYGRCRPLSSGIRTKRFVCAVGSRIYTKITAENGAETSLLGFTFVVSWACLGTLLTRKEWLGGVQLLRLNRSPAWLRHRFIVPSLPLLLHQYQRTREMDTPTGTSRHLNAKGRDVLRLLRASNGFALSPQVE